MTDLQRRVMWWGIGLDSVPLLLASFTNIYAVMYILQNITIADRSMSNMVSTIAAVVLLQWSSSTNSIKITTRNFRSVIFLVNGTMMISALFIEKYPNIVIMIMAINNGVFYNLFKIGYIELVNTIFSKTMRTVYVNRYEQMRHICGGLSAVAAYLLSDLHISIIAGLWFVTAVFSIITNIIHYKILIKTISILQVK